MGTPRNGGTLWRTDDDVRPFPALIRLLADENFWSSLILAVVSGLLGSIVTGVIGHRESMSRAEDSESEAWQRHMDAVNEDLLAPMRKELHDTRERVNQLQAEVDALRKRQDTYRDYVAYVRQMGHWLNGLCQSGALDDKWRRSHPKPRLPDSIRKDISP